MVDAVVQRWESFLDKTKGRAVELLGEASGACARTIAEGECDPNAVFAGWGAVERRTSELARKVRDVWEEQVRTAMESASITGEGLELQRVKGDALRDWVGLEI